MFLKKVLGLNMKAVQMAFIFGAGVGATVGIGLGTGLGAAIGALFAPMKGSDLRAQIKEKVSEKSCELKEVGLNLAEKATVACDNMLEQMEARKSA